MKEPLTVVQLRDKLNSLIEEGYGQEIVETPSMTGFLNQVYDIKPMFSKLEERNCIVLLVQ